MSGYFGVPFFQTHPIPSGSNHFPSHLNPFQTTFETEVRTWRPYKRHLPIEVTLALCEEHSHLMCFDRLQFCLNLLATAPAPVGAHGKGHKHTHKHITKQHQTPNRVHGHFNDHPSAGPQNALDPWTLLRPAPTRPPNRPSPEASDTPRLRCQPRLNHL